MVNELAFILVCRESRWNPTLEHQRETHDGELIWTGSSPSSVVPMMCEVFSSEACGFCFNLQTDVDYCNAILERVLTALQDEEEGYEKEALDLLYHCIHIRKEWGQEFEGLQKAASLLEETSKKYLTIVQFGSILDSQDREGT